MDVIASLRKDVMVDQVLKYMGVYHRLAEDRHHDPESKDLAGISKIP